MHTSDIILNGSPQFGLWFGDIQHPDPRTYSPPKSLPFGISKMWQSLREKRWQYIGLYTSELFLGCAIVHTGYIGNIFCYVFDRTEGVLWEQERLAPLGAGIRIDRSLYSGVSSYHTQHERIRIEARNGIRLFDIRLRDKNQDLDVRLTLQDTPNPLQIVTPTSADDFTFTHKGAALKTYGTVRLGTKKWNIENEYAALDFTFGYPAHHTVWQWLSAHGHTTSNIPFAINGVAPVFHQKFQENVLWLDGKPIPLSPLLFRFDQLQPHQEWSITNQEGTLSLRFIPEGLREQNINYGLVASRFVQPFGSLMGFFTDSDGEKHHIASAQGVVEDHEARW